MMPLDDVSKDLPHELGPSALGPLWLRAGMSTQTT